MKKTFILTLAAAVAVSAALWTNAGMLEVSYGAENGKTSTASKTSATSTTSTASTTSKSSTTSTVSEIAKQFADPSNDPFGYRMEAEKKKALKLAAEEYPESFDLRNVDTDNDGKGDTCFVTPVKYQEPFGTCWGFSAINAAETSILGNPELNKGLSPKTFDLSEKHLAFFAGTALNDPASPQNGEGVHIDSMQERFDMGGKTMYATSLFSSGIGPVLESCGEEYKYKGAHGWTEKGWIDGKYRNIFYLALDNWSMPEQLRFKQSYMLKESYILPSPSGRRDMDDPYKYDPAGTAAIKEQLINRRAVEIGYRADIFDPSYQKHGECMSENWAQYSSMESSANHQVSIVGWDDNYDKSKFIEGNEPPENGAWLIKNSWGSEEEDFPNHGEGNWGIVDPATGKHTGYFWLSYYDKTMDVPEALDFEKKNDDPSYRIDQHDFLPVDEVRAAAVGSVARTANIFRPDSCEEVSQVSCQTTYPGTEVTYEVYLLPEEYKDPSDGILMDTKKEVYKYGGYHKVRLNKPFIVMKGQPYAIVVTQKTTDNKYAVSIQGKIDDGVGIINKGESLVLLDGKWKDFSSKKLQKELTSSFTGDNKNLTIDNFPIKGYGRKLPNLTMTFGQKGNLDITPPDWDDPMYLDLAIRFNGDGDVDVPDDVKTTWTLEEGGEQLVDMKDGRDPSRKEIYGKKCGRSRLIVTADGIGTLIYPIDISPNVTDISKVTPGKKKLTVAVNGLMYRKIDGYQVKYRIKGSKKWITKEIKPSEVKVSSGNVDKFVLKKLKKGKKYQVKVQSWVNTPQGKYYGGFGLAVTSKKIK